MTKPTTRNDPSKEGSSHELPQSSILEQVLDATALRQQAHSLTRRLIPKGYRLLTGGVKRFFRVNKDFASYGDERFDKPFLMTDQDGQVLAEYSAVEFLGPTALRCQVVSASRRTCGSAWVETEGDVLVKE